MLPERAGLKLRSTLKAGVDKIAGEDSLDVKAPQVPVIR